MTAAPEAVLSRPCVVFVKHEDTEKMVGVVISRGDHLVFLHCQSGSQYHHNTRCPSPIDTVLASALWHGKISFYYAYDRTSQTMWRIAVRDLADAPVADYGDRRRLYPPESAWKTPMTRVEEVSAPHGGKAYIEDGGKGGLILLAPFFKAEVPWKVVLSR